MEELNLQDLSIDETKALILQDPVRYFNQFMEETGESLCIFDYSGEPEAINGFELKQVYSEGGYEGGGDHAEVVVGISYGDEVLAHVRFTGFYNSYAGTEWDDSSLERVYPREVVVTQYFNKP
jgi:hypothetical protein